LGPGDVFFTLSEITSLFYDFISTLQVLFGDDEWYIGAIFETKKNLRQHWTYKVAFMDDGSWSTVEQKILSPDSEIQQHECDGLKAYRRLTEHEYKKLKGLCSSLNKKREVKTFLELILPDSNAVEATELNSGMERTKAKKSRKRKREYNDDDEEEEEQEEEEEEALNGRNLPRGFDLRDYSAFLDDNRPTRNSRDLGYPGGEKYPEEYPEEYPGGEKYPEECPLDDVGKSNSQKKEKKEKKEKKGKKEPVSNADSVTTRRGSGPLREQGRNEMKENIIDGVAVAAGGSKSCGDPEASSQQPTPPVLEQVATSEVSLQAWLKELGLAKYIGMFEEEEVDMDSILLLKEADLEKYGVKLGPRKKLVDAIEKIVQQRNNSL